MAPRSLPIPIASKRRRAFRPLVLIFVASLAQACSPSNTFQGAITSSLSQTGTPPPAPLPTPSVTLVPSPAPTSTPTVTPTPVDLSIPSRISAANANRLAVIASYPQLGFESPTVYFDAAGATILASSGMDLQGFHLPALSQALSQPAWQIAQLAVSPDGHSAAIADFQGRVSLLDASDLSQISSPEDVFTNTEAWDNWVMDLAFSPDGSSLAGATQSRAWIWDLEDQEPSRIFAPWGTSALAFTSTGDLLAAAVMSEAISIDLWDVSTGEKVGKVATGQGGFIGSVTALAFSPDDSQLAVGMGGSYHVAIFDPNTAQLVASTQFKSPVNSLCFPGDDGTLAIAADAAYLWGPDMQSPPRRLRPAEEPASGDRDTRLACPSRDGIVAITDKSGISIVDASSGKTLTTTPSRAISLNYHALLPNGTAILIDDAAVRLIDLASGTILRSLPFFSQKAAIAELSSSVLLSAGTTLTVLDTTSGSVSWHIEVPELPFLNNYDYVDWAIDITPDGSKALAVVSGNGCPDFACGGQGTGRPAQLRLWDVSTGTPLLDLTLFREIFNDAAFCSMGTVIAVANGSRGLILNLQGQRTEEVRGFHGPLLSVECLPDQMSLLWTDLSYRMYVSSLTGRAAREIFASPPDYTQYFLGVSPDASLLLVGNAIDMNNLDTPTVRHSTTGATLASLPGAEDSAALFFSTDQRFLLEIGETLRLWGVLPK